MWNKQLHWVLKNKRDTKMKTGKIAFTLGLILTHAAFADTTPSPVPSPSATPACQILRTAKARVYVTKVSFVQQNGTWVNNDQLICSTTADVNVVSQQAPGCSYSQMLTCDSILDGQIHSIQISGLIYFYNPAQPTPLNPAKKEFAVSYYIDRNNGESGFSAATSTDLNLGSAGVNLDTSRDKTASGTAYNDSLNLNVTFDDTNAAQ
jgi:hypothetical protein